MPKLSGRIISQDDLFRTELAASLRGGPVPVVIAAAREGAAEPDIVLIDGRLDILGGVDHVEQVRASYPKVGIVFVARDAAADTILRAMRAGANEFLTWPTNVDALHEAVGRVGARVGGTDRRESRTLVFFGVKGGVGTTTIAVNCGVDLARRRKRSSVIVDLIPGLGEVSLFLGLRSRYTLSDALDNLHRLDQQFVGELTATHQSGLAMLPGCEQVDRPAAADTPAVEEVMRLLSHRHEFQVVDAGSKVTPAVAAAFHLADTIYLVAQPDLPSVRNAQRLLDYLTQTGASGDRVRVLLNRALEPFPVSLAQIEQALGHRIDHTFANDYKTVSEALNAGVPLAHSGNSELAGQFDRFTQLIVEPGSTVAAPPVRKRFGLDLASLW